MTATIRYQEERQNAVVNHTERGRIYHEHFAPRWDWDGEHDMPMLASFEVLGGDWATQYGEDSIVTLEVFKRSNYSSVSLGTVGDCAIPNDPSERKHIGFNVNESLNCRVIITPPGGISGVILASSAVRNVPSEFSKGSTGQTKRNILPIKLNPSMKDKKITTQIQFPSNDTDPVIIYVNGRLPGLLEAVHGEDHSPAVRAVIITPYVQSIANRLVWDLKHGAIDRDAIAIDTDDTWFHSWQGQWHYFFTAPIHGHGLGAPSLLGVDLEDEEEIDNWMGDVLNRWSKSLVDPIGDVTSYFRGSW